MTNVRAVIDRLKLVEALRLAGKVQPWRRAVPQFDAKDGKPLPPKLMPGVVRIDVDTWKARLTVANFDMAIGVDVECNGTEGILYLPLTPLTAFVEKGSASMVELTADGHSTAIVCGRTKASTWGEAQDAPPPVPAIEVDARSVPAAIMRQGLGAAESAAKDDNNRPWLGGIFVHDAPTGPAFAAMDANRLHAKVIEGDAFGAKAILPRAAARMLVGMLPEEGDVGIRLDARGASFEWGQALFRTRLIDAQYPAFQQALNVGTDRVLRANADTLLADLELVACVADSKLQEIRLELGQTCTALASRIGTYGGQDSGQITLDATFAGEPIAIGFQLRLVADALHLFGENQIEWRMGGKFDPTVISSPFVPGTEAMVSPLLPAGAAQKVAA
jgi:DNA polymerase-3 subunit beta